MEYPNTKKKNFFLHVGDFFLNIGKGFVNRFVKFGTRFKEGSLGTKMSHFIMGSGNFYHKRITKGIIYLLLQIGFILIMVLNPKVNNTPIGYKAIVNFFTLGTNEGGLFTGPTDNSMLMLLFGVVTFGIIGIFIFTWNSSIKSSALADQLKKEGKPLNTFKDDLHSLIDEKFHLTMLTPAILGVIMFTILPTIFMIFIAFTDYDSSVIAGQHLFNWVGFKNFTNIFTGKGEIAVRFIPVLTWTLIWAFFATFTNYFGGILVALLINNKHIKFKKVWRTVFMLTIAIPQFISLLAIRLLLSKSGPINTMLIDLGLIKEGIEFLGSATNGIVPKIMIILINIWVGIPFTMLMTSGILMNIPQDLYEAAVIDGANRRQVFFKITLPYVIFVTTPYLISSFVGNITSFNIIFLLTGGGPAVPGGYTAGRTDLLVTWLYKLTIDEGNYNLGAVIGILTFLITATGTLLTYRRSQAFKEEDAFQ
ncbi:MAG: sugar ABC transporter permease [Acholeplasmataceae bacterium]